MNSNSLGKYNYFSVITLLNIIQNRTHLAPTLNIEKQNKIIIKIIILARITDLQVTQKYNNTISNKNYP